MAASGYRAGINNLSNVVQLVQSRPEFESDDQDKQQKKELFASLPYFPIKRMFDCMQYKKTFPQDSEYIGVFVDSVFHNTYHIPSNSSGPFNLVTTVSNPNLPKKGINELLTNLRKTYNSGAQISRLSIISNQSYVGSVGDVGFDVNFLSLQGGDKERAEILANSDIYVTCTVDECPGLAQLEALAVGLPSVAYDSYGNNDYYTSNNFIMTDESNFIRDLKSLTSDALRAQYSMAAKASAKEFTEEGMYRRFQEALKIFFDISPV